MAAKPLALPSGEALPWELDEWLGMVMRRAVVKDGVVVSERFQRVPVEKSWEAAMAWAAKEYAPR